MSSEPGTGWGVWLHAVRPLPELADLAAAAERRGAGAILIADEGTDRDLHVTMATLALRTRSALLVAAVTNPHSRHPVATAAAFASLNELAPGRIVAGFGAGGSRVFGPMGLAPPKPFTALRETIDIVDDLLGGKVVSVSGAITVAGASLPWSRGSVPIAVAGRGPNVEALAGERADWVLLAGKSVTRVEALVARLRQGGAAARGRPPAIAWNPVAAWTDELVSDVRAHLAYITVDLPAADRRALGVDDELVARLRAVVTSDGAEAAGPMVPQAVVDEFAIIGSRAGVAARLGEIRARMVPELLVFDAGDYSERFVDELAVLAEEAGATPHWVPTREP